MADALSRQGWRIGIVSRGYGAQKPHRVPFLINSQIHTPQESGEEAWWLAQRTGRPVVVCNNRYLAAKALMAHAPQTTLILSDDGLQHYRLPRHVECAMLPPPALLSHPRLLPWGVFREHPGR